MSKYKNYELTDYQKEIKKNFIEKHDFNNKKKNEKIDILLDYVVHLIDVQVKLNERIKFLEYQDNCRGEKK